MLKILPIFLVVILLSPLYPFSTQAQSSLPTNQGLSVGDFANSYDSTSLSFGRQNTTGGSTWTERPTGLNEGDGDDLVWIREHFPVAKDIRINEIALQRINVDRSTRGLSNITGREAGVSAFGQEAVFDGSAAVLSSSSLGGDVLPRSVDNSELPAFPPIGDQGSWGSCVAFSTTYYQFTYEQNMLRGGVADGGDYDVIFSPKWTYNMINNGRDGGSAFRDAYEFLLNQGAAKWAEFPYDGDYLTWCQNRAVWRNALDYRLSGEGWGMISDGNVTHLIDDVKTQIANGHVLVVGTYISSWVIGSVLNDPSTSADDPYVGQDIAIYKATPESGGHGMTLVGYNDDIWCDVNGNGVVDGGEGGAFKIANSWSSGWGNEGFCWVAYDALGGSSLVSPTGTWPPADRCASGIFKWSGSSSHDIFFITALPNPPSIVVEFTLYGSDRSQMYSSIRVAPVKSTPEDDLAAYSQTIFSGAGGGWSFDGSTYPCEMTFVCASDEPSLGSNNRWYLRVNDPSPGDPTTVSGFRLYEVTPGGDILVGDVGATSITIDGDYTYLNVDYRYGSFDVAPKAVINAHPLESSTSIQFDGSGSMDPDGDVVSYTWDFGDGSSDTGPTVVHDYADGTTYQAWLTVTDDDGSESADNFIIETGDPNFSPGRNYCYVGDYVSLVGSIPTYNGDYKLGFDSNGDSAISVDEVIVNGTAAGYTLNERIRVPDSYGGAWVQVVLTDTTAGSSYTGFFYVFTGFKLTVDRFVNFCGGPFTIEAVVSGAPVGYDGTLDLRLRVTRDWAPVTDWSDTDIGQVGWGRVVQRYTLGPDDPLLTYSLSPYIVFLDWDLDGAFPEPRKNVAATGFYVDLMDRWTYQRTENVLMKAYVGVPGATVRYQLTNPTGSIITLDPLVVEPSGFAPEVYWTTMKDQPLGNYDVEIMSGETVLDADWFTLKRANLRVEFTPGGYSHNGTVFTVDDEEVGVDETVSARFHLSYPDGSPVAPADLLAWPTVYIYADSSQVEAIDLNYFTDYDVGSEEWIVNWLVPGSARLGGGYEFTITRWAIRDLYNNIGPEEPMSTGSMLHFKLVSGGAPYATTFHIRPGWNLLGAPGSIEEPQVNEVFSNHTSEIDAIYGYDDGEWTYWIPGIPSTFTTLEAGHGFWLSSSTEYNVTVVASSVDGPPLTEEWNLICTTTGQVEDLGDYLTGSGWSSVYGYSSEAQDWVYNIGGLGGPLTTLRPGDGYWVYVED